MSATVTVRSALGLAVRADLPVLLWGEPGTGKSSAVVALGAQLGVPVEVVVGSVREPSDFVGLPVVREDSTWFAPPRWAQRLASAGAGVLFLDELTTAPPAVQAAMLRVILDRTVGDLVLPAGVRIVAAANPPSLAADGWELSAPLANRLVHLDWQVSASDIADGFVSGFATDGTAGELVAPTAAQVAAARAQLGAFLRVRPELTVVVPDSPDRAGRAWPSPRTWEMAAVGLAAGRANDSPRDVVAALVVGSVGQPAGFEALSWLSTLDLPDPQTLLDDPGVALPDRSDRLYALLGALVAHVAADGGAQMWEQAWEPIARVAATAPDVAATSARTLALHRPAGARLPTAMLALAPVLRAVGLQP